MSFTKLFYMYMHSGTLFLALNTEWRKLFVVHSIVFYLNTINETCWIKTSEVQKLLK